jgi:hypothetical protein
MSGNVYAAAIFSIGRNAMKEFNTKHHSSVLAAIILMVVVLGCVDGRRGSRLSNDGTTTVDDSVPKLEVTSWKLGTSASGNFVEVDGEVVNSSNQPIDSLRVTAEFRTSDGTFITSEDGFVDYSPLMPGQSSPFKIMGRFNPQMATARLRFKTLFGGEINYIDNSKRDEPKKTKKKK